MKFTKLLSRRRVAMNVAGIVVWSVAMGASFSFINGLGIFATALQSPGGPSVSQALIDATCKVTASGLPYDCTGNTQAPGSVVGTVFTFGDFAWSFVKAIPTMIAGVIVPGSLAQQWFGGIGLVVNAVLLIMFSFWAWGLVGNRHQDMTPE